MRSGKSRLAERLAHESGLKVLYLATATPGDEEMAERIVAHRERRPADWMLVEEPVALAGVLEREAHAGQIILVECLTLWLTNLLMLEDDARLAAERDALIALVPRLPGRLVLVGNETNSGVIPLSPLARRFCDEAGFLHQALAARCDCVALCVAGLPQLLKGHLS